MTKPIINPDNPFKSARRSYRSKPLYRLAGSVLQGHFLQISFPITPGKEPRPRAKSLSKQLPARGINENEREPARLNAGAALSLFLMNDLFIRKTTNTTKSLIKQLKNIFNARRAIDVRNRAGHQETAINPCARPLLHGKE